MSDVSEGLAGIWERLYFTNNGPLVREFDREMARLTGSCYAVAVVNASTALLLTIAALERTGEIILPALGAGRTADVVRWLGCTAVFADVDEYGGLEPSEVRRLTGKRTIAAVGVHLDGIPCDAIALERVARELQLALIFDARSAAGSTIQGRSIGTFGDAEVFGLLGPEGEDAASVTTDSEAMYDRIRTMRSFHSNETFADVAFRANGKLSEAQALLALSGLRSTAHCRAGDDVLASFGSLPRTTSLEQRPGVFCGPQAAIVFDRERGDAASAAARLRRKGFDARSYAPPLPGFPRSASIASRRLVIAAKSIDNENRELLRLELDAFS